MTKNWLAAGALAATMTMTATASYAQTTTVPGEQVGLATGAPLPEGIYALNTFVYRSNENVTPGSVDVGVNVPVLVWSTPFVPFGGRIELLVAPPTVFAFGKNGGPNGSRDLSINVGTFVGGIWAFDLGGNVGVSLLGGVYLNELNGDRGVLVNNAGTTFATPVLPQLASNTYRAGIAISYTGDGYNLTANLTGNFYDSPATFGGNNAFGTRGPFIISDSLNLDLTATKKFGKFEIGAIGYGTVNLDTSPNSLAFRNRGNFSLGGLIGYDFGPFTAQAYVATTVANAVRRADTVEGWFRVIVPLYSPTPVVASAAPIVRKY
ncbi:CoxB-like protein [Methylobacterium sp. Leaf399]|uniref:transporter n=1 Tax=unclassified Methylobacterium TaxID=2615210 RepID=UPI0006FC267C|nr:MULTISPECIES: transporter [unclassified Methylobacterium]KQP48931.1 CoxB-like protein [Methylobacterium sp. Leaf108]KQT15593.1 CoxB-like protein [Methylobacterium sp. Leaf399]KQT83354.1 CoxB-like protein [Methylobacterium sp. Leaf466]